MATFMWHFLASRTYDVHPVHAPAQQTADDQRRRCDGGWRTPFCGASELLTEPQSTAAIQGTEGGSDPGSPRQSYVNRRVTRFLGIIVRAIFQLSQFICFEIMSFIVYAKHNKRCIINDDDDDDGDRCAHANTLANWGELFHIHGPIHPSTDPMRVGCREDEAATRYWGTVAGSWGCPAICRASIKSASTVYHLLGSPSFIA